MAGKLGGALAVPLALLMFGAWWQRSEQAAAASRAELNHAAGEIESTLLLAPEFSGLQLWFTDSPCPFPDASTSALPADVERICLKYYLAHLGDLDKAVTRLSWKLNTAPVSRSLNDKVKEFKKSYWGGSGQAGWRQRANEAIWGTPSLRGLRFCYTERTDPQVRAGCEATRSVVRAEFVQMNDQLRTVFCDLVSEINELRVAVVRSEATVSLLAERVKGMQGCK